MTNREAYNLAKSFWALGLGALLVERRLDIRCRAFRRDWLIWSYGKQSPVGFNAALKWANEIWKERYINAKI